MARCLDRGEMGPLSLYRPGAGTASGNHAGEPHESQAVPKSPLFRAASVRAVLPHSADRYSLYANEFSLELGLAVFQKHFDHFPEVPI